MEVRKEVGREEGSEEFRFRRLGEGVFRRRRWLVGVLLFRNFFEEFVEF